MKFLAYVILCASLLDAATINVCNSGCTTSNLQTALDTLAACGDTIQIKSTDTQTGSFTITYRGCVANPITVTSDRAAWLPPAGARITPSHLANMAQIITNTSAPALGDVLDGMNRPPAGWIFIGIAFSTTNGSTYALVSFNGSGTRANSSQIADNIKFDRCYFWMSSAVVNGSPGIQDVIRADATNLTVKNSFFGDAFLNGLVESHGIRALATSGPFTATNNFITASGIPIFVGGTTPSYPAYLENGATVQYNYFWRPWKWNYDPAQPFAADYVTAAQNTLRQDHTVLGAITNISNPGVITFAVAPFLGPYSMLTISGVGGCTVANAALWRITQLTSTTFQLLNFPGCNSAYTSGGSVDEYAITVCQKNLGEFKWGTGISWQYNVGENSWFASQCMTQWNSFSDTFRPEYDPLGVVMSFTNSTHLTWTGIYRIGGTGARTSIVNDVAVCVSMPTTGTECHAVSSFSGATLITATPFSAAPGGTYNAWVSYTGGAKLENLTVSRNVYKNTDTPDSVVALGFANGVGDAGFGKTHTLSQNLFYSDNSYVTGQKAISIEAAEADFAVFPSGYVWDHNTFYYPYGMSDRFVYVGATQCGSCSTAIQPPFDASALTNNLFGVSATGGISGDTYGNDTIQIANHYFSNSNIKNNVVPTGAQTGAASGGNVVSGNIYSWTDPFGGLASSRLFAVSAGSAYHNAATDGTDIGADFTQLPLANSLKVLNNLLSFDLSSVNNDAKNTQPCVLEVSPSRNLVSDLGTYTVTADLDPTLTIGADLSTRADVSLSGNHVTWPLKGLTVGTTYYGRIMCYGDSEWFSFTAVPTQNSPALPGRAVLPGKLLAHRFRTFSHGLSEISRLLR